MGQMVSTETQPEPIINTNPINNEILDTPLIERNDQLTPSITDNSIAISDIEIKTDMIPDPKIKFTISDEVKGQIARELLKAEIANSHDKKIINLQRTLITRAMIDIKNENSRDLLLENKMLSESLEKYKQMYFDLRKLVDDHHTDVLTPLE